jgi:hypothetical protein
MTWYNPISTAKKDGKFLFLFVDYTDGDHPLEDEERVWTVGVNSFENTGVDEWKFVGWSWAQDTFTQGKGKVLGWMPFSFPPV